MPYLMRDFLKWLKSSRKLNPVVLASEAHCRLVTIHPFINRNGGTVRLHMAFVLLKTAPPP